MTDDRTRPVGTLGERGLIERIRRRAGSPPDWVTLGIGDDAAALRPDRNTEIIVTTDSLIQDVHFRRDWSSLESVGHKALAVNLSDLAAMGAKPRACLLSLALPAGFTIGDLDELLDGFLALARETGTPLVGGNLSRSPGPLLVDVTAVGSVGRRRILTRRGGRPGDEMYLTGRIGGAAAGLALLRAGVDRAVMSQDQLAAIARLERPVPRLRVGRLASQSRGVTACMDLSDGLADAAHQIAGASQCCAALEATRLPLDPSMLTWAAETGADALPMALSGGEDYELLFVVSPRRRSAFRSAMRRCPDVQVTLVGRLEKGAGAYLERDGQRESIQAGFLHF